jgi:endonuclease/exonuclease/phosphatase family metal-dependent hydrolase
MAERLVVRTWNLFHGRTSPETRHVHLERMIAVATGDRPDVVCLQEVPVWALARLERWSGMQARTHVTKRALLGPLARTLQRVDAHHVRSPWTGQANALLVARTLEIVEHGVLPLNAGDSAERRVCQLARLRFRATGSSVAVANLHATNRSACARQELESAERLFRPGGPTVVCGDFNIRATGLAGFSPPLPGIDQVLVRDLELVDRPTVWPQARRRLPSGVLLSDHAPVEAAMMAP